VSNQQILERMISRARVEYWCACSQLQRARKSGDAVDLRLAQRNHECCREILGRLETNLEIEQARVKPA